MREPIRFAAAPRPPSTRRSAEAPRGGFTLLEIVVALAVFAVISVLATRILGGIVSLADVGGARSDALADLQRAMAVLERDVGQMVRRPVRDQLGDPGAAVAIGDGRLIEFTRQGWQNPLGEPRTTLQRVAYEHRDGTLTRLFWPVLDRAPDSEPVAQVLLQGVAHARFLAHDDVADEHRYWPPGRGGEAGVDLAAVELQLETIEFGRLVRLWMVPGDSGFLAERAASQTLPGTTPEDEEEEG